MSVAKLLYFDIQGFGRVHAKEGSFSPAGMKKNKEIADTGVVGTAKEPKIGKLKFRVANTPGGPTPSALDELEDVNVTVKDDADKTFLCIRASTTNDVELSGGWMTVEMEFDSQEEVS
jgi:Phage tail tube protein